LRQIDEKYIEAGLVRFDYRHFVILGPQSQKAAEASECAAEQGSFWPFHDLLFDRKARNVDDLKRLAADLSLDTAAFDNCLDSGTYESLVRDETELIASLGVRGTPAFVINGQPLAGAQPFEIFEQIIEAELAGVNR
jgi:protein-disulfide isomerase